MIAVELSNIVQSQTVVIEEQRASSEIFFSACCGRSRITPKCRKPLYMNEHYALFVKIS
jgi:hypothetical protein